MKKTRTILCLARGSIAKILLKMKLLTVLMLSAFAVSAGNIYSQQTKFNLELNNTTMRVVFQQIEDNSEFVLLYNEKVVDVDRKVNVNAKNVTVETVLEQTLNGTNNAYKIYDRQIVILENEHAKIPLIINSKTVQPQSKTVKGTVTDVNGERIPGVSIVVKGTTIGVTTDGNGDYSLDIPSKSEFLVFSFVGMKSQIVSIVDKEEVSVVLEDETFGVDEVIVVGYGTQKKVNVTGAVSSVSMKDLENRPLPNVGEVLRGVSPNLNISLGAFGGEPGATPEWNIRGMGSISGNDAPLILVDGVEMNINNLDPGNIESVSVLKDASASAIYGARAPFGVVLITTKKGNKNGKMQVQYNNNFTFGTTLGVGHLENSLTYATAYNQASVNAGSPPIYNDEYLARIKGYIDGTYLTEYDPENPPHNIWAGRRVGNANYDWPSEWLKPVKVDQRHSINISGGDDKTQYYLSLGFYDEDGYYSTGYDDYKRYDLMANFNTKVTDWLSFNLSTKFANSNTDHPHGITTVERRYIWLSLYSWSPLTPKYNINGSISNPWLRSMESSGRIKTKSNDFLVTAGTEIEPVEGWKTNIAYTYNVTSSNVESNPKPVWVELGTGGFGNVGKPIASYEASFSTSPYSLISAITSYEMSFGNHYIKALVGYEQEQKFYSSLYGAGGQLISEEVPSISTSLGASMVDDTKWDWATQGIFGRINYNYKEKYLLEVSARYNGSSRFAPDSRWGFFPSASAGYQISKENFWLPIKSYVNSLKVRASYGSLGNQNVSRYLYIASVPVKSETPWLIGGERPPYAFTPNLISDDLTWETITTTNIGLDAGFLKNRLELNFDWFKRTTTNMFGPAETLPYTLGTSTPKANNAELETKGFELILSWKDRISSDFSYNAQISLGDAKSTILKYRNDNGFINSWYAGKNVGELWGYETEGIIQTQEEAESMADQSAIYSRWGPGDIRYKDLNGDKKITNGGRTLDDHGDLKVIGNTSPRYNLGISGGFNWKGFDFSMQWYGNLKRDYHPAYNNKTFNGITHTWSNSGIIKGSPTLDYWRPADETNMFGPNTDAYFPKPYFSSETYKNVEIQSKYVLNAAYLRLKNIQVGYTIPGHISEKVYLQNARIYVSGQNLITIKSLPKSIDPESVIDAATGYTDSGGFYPMSRSFSVGLNLTF